MMCRGFLRSTGATAVLAVSISCGGSGSSGSSSSSPTSPTPPGTPPSGPACRIYPTNRMVHTATSGSSVTFDALESATFSTATKQATILTNFANGAPCSTTLTNYNSVADFVDEVRVNPGLVLSTGNSTTNSNGCGSGTASGTNTFDGQRRLVQVSNSAGGVTTYTAWDSAGRPTAGRSNGGLTIANTYDDAAHTWTATQTQPNGTTSVATNSFDANGNETRLVLVQGNTTTTTTFTITSTATVCK